MWKNIAQSDTENLFYVYVVGLYVCCPLVADNLSIEVYHPCHGSDLEAVTGLCQDNGHCCW